MENEFPVTFLFIRPQIEAEGMRRVWLPGRAGHDYPPPPPPLLRVCDPWPAAWSHHPPSQGRRTRGTCNREDRCSDGQAADCLSQRGCYPHAGLSDGGDAVCRTRGLPRPLARSRGSAERTFKFTLGLRPFRCRGPARIEQKSVGGVPRCTGDDDDSLRTEDRVTPCRPEPLSRAPFFPILKTFG